MTFHRFLAGTTKRRLPLRIFVEKQELKPWDPFCLSEKATIAYPEVVLDIDGQSKPGSVRLRPYILPPQAAFSSTNAHTRAAGPNGWNDQQGFYFYRNDRLIRAGGWNAFFRKDEHNKLARIAVDYTSADDDLFQVDVAKQMINMPPAVREELKSSAANVRMRANEIYRQGGTRTAPKSSIQQSTTRTLYTATGTEESFLAEAPHNSTHVVIGGRTDHVPPTQQLTPSLDPTKRSTNHELDQQSESTEPTTAQRSLWDRLRATLVAELSDDPERLTRVLNAVSLAVPELRAIRRLEGGPL